LASLSLTCIAFNDFKTVLLTLSQTLTVALHLPNSSANSTGSQFQIELILTFKVLTTRQPTYLHSLINPYSSSRSLRSSSQHRLSIPRISSATQAKAFSSYAPLLWNNLPQSLRHLAFQPGLSSGSSSYATSTTDTLTEASKLVCFKRNLKTFLFDCPPKSLVP